MSVMASRPLVRWVVPAGVLVAVVGGGAITTALRASADVTLPARSAAQLLVDLQTARLDGVSGTVVERAELGLPTLPNSLGGDGSSQLNSLVSGSHTLRVWYSGPDKARIALLGAMGESDVIRNGEQGWVWSSGSNTATHFTMPAESGKDRKPISPAQLPSTPQDAANQVLAALDPSTAVTTESGDTVAGRSAYELVFTPKDGRSLVARVKVAIDGKEHVPLRVQVYAKGHASPAFETAFQQVSFARPDAGVFTFSPPSGVKITEASPDGIQGTGKQPKTAVIGKGWTSVLAVRSDTSLGSLVPGGSSGGSPSTERGQRSAQAFLDALPTVSGPWGSGKVLSSRLFTVLLTDDGRVLVGAVSQQQLLAAAADPAAALK